MVFLPFQKLYLIFQNGTTMATETEKFTSVTNGSAMVRRRKRHKCNIFIIPCLAMHFGLLFFVVRISFFVFLFLIFTFKRPGLLISKQNYLLRDSLSS